MLRWMIALMVPLALYGASDPWAKVRELKSGTELRIFKKDSKKAVIAKMDEANDEHIVVVIKNEQTAIPKEEIDRVDYRPSESGGRVRSESTTTEDTTPRTAGRMPGERPGLSRSSSSAINVGSKPDFETIYRRTPMLPPAKKE